MHISGLTIDMIESFWKLCVFVVFFVVFSNIANAYQWSGNKYDKELLEIVCFCRIFCCCTCSKKKKKLVRGVSGWCLANPSFSRIFGIFQT